METHSPAHETLKFRLVSRAYQTLPTLKYWAVRQGYLNRIGWTRSNWARIPLDASGAPLPWLTYPAIEFLQGRLRRSMRVFEYGSGQSTRWWARQVDFVHSVEDDQGWYESLVTDLPANVDLRFADSSTNEYASSIAARDERFDVVVIDGSARNECAQACLPYLKDDGVIVFDNTEEPNLFGEGLSLLRTSGFRRIDFHGIAPLTTDPHATSVLYRPASNCLGI